MTEAGRMTGGQALVGQLVREGVRVVFGLPGVQLYGAVAALREEPRVRFVVTRHEQATTYMADGYARAGGEVGVALVVPGPGLLNAAAGLATAYAASSPVLVLSGQIPRAQIGRRVGVLHEVDDQLQAIAPITRWRRRVLEAAEIPGAVHEALAQLRTGRPRPVELEMPPDALEEEAEVALRPAAPVVRPAAPDADIEAAAGLLAAAERPVLYAGGGVNLAGAGEPLAALADYLQAGVITTPEGKGAVSDASPLSLGAGLWAGSPLRRHLEAADLILAVGTRFALAQPRPEQAVIQIDVDPEEIGRNHAGTRGLVGDARATLLRLLEAVRAAGPPRPSRKAEHERLRAAVLDHAQEPQDAILRSLRAGVPEETVLVADMTQLGYYARVFWPVYRPRTYLTTSYAGTLGAAYPLALGAKVARPDRPVVAVCGDGGFLFNVQELATAVQHRIAVVAVVFNDDAYGNVARDLDEVWGGSFGADLRNPDFVRLAEAFGVPAVRAERPTDVGRLVGQALAQDRPALVEVPVGPMPRPVFFPPRRPTRYRP